MGLTRLAIMRPLTVLMVILGIVLMGAISYTHLRVDRLPPIDIPFLGINVSYPQASAQDVELLVTQPIENAVSGLSGVTSVSSNSNEGRASVTIRFANGTNIDAAALEVGRRVAAIRRQLPADATDPTIFKADPNASPILNIALHGAPIEQLFDLANTSLQPALQSVPGVASVSISGGLQREIQVQVNYTKLAAYGVTIQQISTALTAANVTSPIGNLDQGSKTLNMRAVGAVDQLPALEQLVIQQTTTGGAILLRDVATVTEGYKQQTQFQRMNGADAVGLTVVKQSDANELQVASGVKAKLRELSKLLPEGTDLQITNDNSIFTRASLDSIQRDLVLAILLVGVVMLLFLHQWRNTVIVLLAIPTVLISTFLFMYALGFTLNIMTLMALALMIGILVDDSIVVLENIHRHLELGESPISAALNGRSEIGLAAIAITLADVIVYAPIAFVSGTVGQLFRQYGLTIVIATLLSLIISFTLTPMIASRWMRHEVNTDKEGLWNRFGQAWDRAFARLGDLIARSVPIFVRSRWLVTIGSISMLGVCAALLWFGALGTEYAPVEDDGNLRVSVNMPSGTSLSANDDAARQMEAVLRTIPEVKNIFTSVNGGGANLAVEIGSKHDRNRSASAIADEIRALGRTIPGASVSASINSPLGGGGGTNAVSVQISGPDLDTLTQIATQVQAIGTSVPSLSALQSSGLQASPELHIQLDRARMAQLGVTSQSVATILRTSLTGSTVSALRRSGQPQVDITIVGAASNRASLNDLMAVPIAGTTGSNAATATAPVTLGQIATIVPGSGPVQIQRTDRNRTLNLRGVASGRALGPVAADLRAEIAKMDLPPAYSVTLGGQVQQLDEALTSLSQALILAVVLEYMLLVALYQSWFYPLVRMMAVPLGLVGALVGLIVTGNTLNIFSIIGLVMAEGLVAKTSILLIDYTNTLREEGMERTAALAEAARTRLRPILMTSATMVFGMFPLALRLEAGAESRAPIAVVVIGALVSSTVLTLIVVPALYTLFDDLATWFAHLGRATTAPPGGSQTEHSAPQIEEDVAFEPEASATGGTRPDPMPGTGAAGGGS
ncbi:MAG: efflux RND transporter permease subunit [Chloroflexota bacterium]